MTFLTLPLSVREEVLALLAQGLIAEAIDLLAKHGYRMSKQALLAAHAELEATVTRARLDSLLEFDVSAPTPRPGPKR